MPPSRSTRATPRGRSTYRPSSTATPGTRRSDGRTVHAYWRRSRPSRTRLGQDRAPPSPHPRGLRHGFADLMDAYNGQRVGAATVALGLAQGAYEKAVTYANRREQFGRPIAEFQGLQWMMADMSIALEASRALIWKAALSASPGGFPDAVLAARAKILAADTAIKVTNDALQIWGAAGYSRDNPLERYLRDARMFT